MRRFVLGLFAAIGVLTALVVVGLGIVVWRVAGTTPSLPDNIVLTADLGGGLTDSRSPDMLSALAFGSKPTLRKFLDALDRAGNDARVKGIYAHIGGDTLALATCQELRDAIAAFRAKGKFAIVFSESFGEFGPGTRPYYLATAFDEIWLQPLGTVGLIGLHSEMPFFRNVLNQLGVEPSFAHREEYKTAMNNFTETAMTPPQREEIDSLLNAASGQIVQGIAATRKLPPDKVNALIDGGPFIAVEAQKNGLIDRIGHRDEALTHARERAGSGAELVSVSRYRDTAGAAHDSGPTIALIYATGLITGGDGGGDPILGDNTVTAGDLGRAFRQAVRDRDVKAIVFRINSPGGSAVASETIWREVERAREHGKPVIVSMGDVAGSGGYYIAAPANKIVAEPATLTGSIGVLAGKIVIADLLQKLNINTQAVQRGANASMFSAFGDFSPAAHQRLDAFLDDTYAGFKQHVANGRHLSADQVEAVAKGRVWSGDEAKGNGLVDELGGYDTAFRLAKEAAKMPADQSFTLTVFPHEKSLPERLYDRLHGNERGAGVFALAVRKSVSDKLSGVLSGLDALTNGAAVLRMPQIGEIR
ncbi:MAG TPA: signal peptide peptidase SppA [Stellaceae bacterium]|nr:signal peptide peptidase SppA [Stellaceae bacterium]